MASSTARISPTAWATGHMWYRHGLSHRALATRKGWALDHAFGALSGVVARGSGVSFDTLMLTRHLGIDDRLQAAIESGAVGQVVELASGLSARGWRFSKRYGSALHYLETDLPHMVEEKRRLLQAQGLLHTGHELISVDVLKEGGEDSIAGLAQRLDPSKGVAIITEGLMNYFSPDQAAQVWRQVAQLLQTFPAGVYLSDVYLTDEVGGAMLGAFKAVLQQFVRGRMHIHFESPSQAIDDMHRFGFADVRLLTAAELPSVRHMAAEKGAQRVRVLEAWV